MRYLKYIAVFLLGFLFAKFWYEKKVENNQKEEIKVMLNTIKNSSKLVVSKGTFSEVYNYSESKKYFYDYLSFDKKAIVTVNATVEVGYDLSQLEIQLDTIKKEIYINKTPKEEITIVPVIKYFDLQQSQFNAFTKEELNKINQKSVEKIKETIEMTNLKTIAKTRFFEEIAKIYQLSSVYHWKVIDNTHSGFLEKIIE